MTEVQSNTSTAFRGAVQQRNLEKFLTFLVGGQEYCLSINHVEEIVGMVAITRLPNTPAHVRGVINLRGRIIPIVDLRTRLGLPATEASRSTCIVVAEVQGQAGKIRLGLIVDEVDDVVDVDPSQIQDAESLMDAGHTGLLHGAGIVEERVRLMLDIDRVLSTQDHRILAEYAQKG